MELEHVLSVLSQGTNKLVGYKITALETNVVLNPKPLQDFLKSINYRADQAEALQENGKNIADADTNVCGYTYRFGDDMVLISCEQFDASGKLKQMNKTLATSNEIREYHALAKTFGANDKSRVGWAEIRNRGTNALFGLPIFLSKSSLSSFIKSHSILTCETGRSLTGQNCVIITTTGEIHSPVDKYRFYFLSDTISPIEFDTYLANGDNYSRTELQFKDSDSSLSLCEKADEQIFANALLFRSSTWILGHAEKEMTTLGDNVDTIIPPQTQVADERYSKNLSYYMGLSPPNNDEIMLMLTNKYGVAQYEAKNSHLHPNDIDISSKKNLLIRIILITFMACPVLVLSIKLLRKL